MFHMRLMMEEFAYSGDYDDPLLAELYDRFENYAGDVELIRRLVGNAGPLNILECFSGTGRILVPLAQEGHWITGIERAPAMNARAAAKVAALGEEVARRVTLRVQDALDGDWGVGYDLVIIGGNGFYELPSAAMQEQCICLAWRALATGGHLFVDNDDYKGDWGQGPFGRERVIFEGEGMDGIYGRYSMESLRFDEGRGVLYMKRTCLKRAPDGRETRREYLGKKHPVSCGEVAAWLEKYGFRILRLMGDRQGNPHTEASGRAIFWAEKIA